MASLGFEDNLLATDPVNQCRTLEELWEIARVCRSCSLAHERNNVVLGHGNHQAKLVLIGEAPGAEEDRQGKPFIGAAGQLLSKILAAAEIPREEVYICNVGKCRPPGNRLPNPAEVAACRPYLEAQLRIIAPKIIVLLGALATQTMIGPEARITKVRGQWYDKYGARLMPTFHPAALLRDPSRKRPVWEDFQQIRDYYRQLK